MNLNINKFDSEEFLSKWVAGELSKEDVQDFENWLAEHPDKQEYFSSVKSIWELSSKINPSALKNNLERWNELENKIKQITPSPPDVRPVIRKVFAVAASILVAVGLVWWHYLDTEILVTVTSGEIQTIYLPDSSKVIINAGSEIGYNPDDWNEARDINLNGEAYFEVRKGKPFSVVSNFTITTVLGTRFNIHSRNENVEVACTSGKVLVQSLSKNENRRILSPGYAAEFFSKGEQSKAYVFNEKQILGWIDGSFYFSRTPLSEVLEEIERQYAIEINFDVSEKTMLFTGHFNKDDIIENTLESICLVSGLKYSKESATNYTVYKEK